MGWKDIEDKRAYQREYMQAQRRLLRGLGLCVECKQKDAYTMAGRRLCAECAERQNENKRRRYQESAAIRDEKAAEAKARRQERREGRLCTTCGTPLPSTYYPYVTCEQCRSDKRERSMRARRETGIMPKYKNAEAGLCVRCGKPRMDGLTAWGGEPIQLCEKCYRDTCAASVIGRKAAERKLGTSWGNFQYEYERLIRHGDGQERANP